jgi:histidinol phosphatase-like PHP family hydrolase/predicted phosphodiesterase
MTLTIAVLADVHYGDPPPITVRRGDIGAVLLRRAIERFNRVIKPDLVLVLGDLLQEPEAPRAQADLMELRVILDRLKCPWLVIPGNHDPDPQRFYQIMPPPAETFDLAPCVRVLTFVDPEEPGYNARRLPIDLQRLRGARRDGFDGLVIAAQHVPVCPPHARLRYSYTNIDQLLEAAKAGGVDFCIAGHCHQQTASSEGRCQYLTTAALCESPHPYTLLTIDDQRQVTVRHETLAMPGNFGLVDYHSHTQFAYCGRDVSTAASPPFAQCMNLRGMALSEHSGQLYVAREDYWSGRFCDAATAATLTPQNRMDDYFNTAAAVRSSRVLVGLEVDADFDGRLVLQEHDRQRAQLIIGAVHFLPESVKPPEQRDHRQFVEQFRFVTERLCQGGIDILAHPFRIFRRAQVPTPAELYPWLARLLKERRIASELNFHTNEPHPQFVRMCLEMGIKLSFGGDAHELWEVGEFYPHLKLLESIGVSGNPRDLMVDLIGRPVPAPEDAPVAV